MSKIIVDQIQGLSSDDVNIPGTLSVDGEITAGGINNLGPLKDSNDSVGTEGQVLTSTGEGTNWVSLDLEFATDAQLAEEAGIRAAADSELQDGLNAEIADRIAGDEALQDNIDIEVTNRVAGDSALQADIDAEIVDRTAADLALQNAIDTETQLRESADSDLAQSIINETNARTAADDTLQSNIDEEELNRIAGDSNLQDNIQAEAQTRLLADNVLTQAIADEADTRLSTDTQLQENINQEAQTRANADGALQANIDAEESARITADDNLEAVKVPYTGATGNVDLGAHKLTTQTIQVSGGTGTQGTLSWNTEDQTLDLIVSDHVTYQIGQELGHVARNLSGQDIGNGMVVKVTGASGNKITIDIADSSSEYDSASTFAVVTEPINNNSTGRVTTEGLVRGLDTSAFAEGIAIWLGENGQFTDVKPLSPNHLVHIGWVVRSHATEGAILVRVSNGWEMEELHDVLITNISAGQILQWDAVAGVWVNTDGLDSIYQSLSGDIESVQLNLDAEINARISADSTLASAISGETSARITFDDDLQAQITSNDGDIAVLQDDLADEVIARQQGDTVLHNEIVAEATTRAAEDANLQGQIDSNDIDIADLYATKEDVANKGVANGYASLDASGKVPESQLPDSVLGSLEYQGTWDASTDTPTLPTPDTSNNGHYYKVSVEGTYLGETYHVGDWAVSNGTDWQHIHTTETISSVFGRTGEVIAIEADYSSFYPLIQDLTDETTARTNADSNLQGQISSNDNDIAVLQAGVSQNASDIAAIDLQTVTDVGNTTTNSINVANLNATNVNATNVVSARRAELGGSDLGLNGNLLVLDGVDENLLQVSVTGIQIGSTAQPIDTYAYGQLQADSIKKIGGTSSQFLKADGSVDSNDYLVAADVTLPNNATITITTGGGLSGTGDFTTDQSVNETITISHADTSAQPSVTGTTNTFVDGVTLDTYGHVTGLTTQSVTIPNPNNATITLSAGTGMTGGGDFTTDQGTNETITISHADTSLLSGVYGSTASGTKINEITIDGFGHITAITTGATGDIDGVTAGAGLTGGGTSGTVTISHADTSAQGSVDNSGGTVIQDITLDTYGHITGLGSVNLDDRYYTEIEADGRFINASGDTMSGTLTLSAISGTDQTVENNYGAYLHLGGWAVARTAANAVLVNTAYRADYADNLFDMNISRFTNNSGYITSSGRAYPRRSDGGDLNFYWSGQSGQPTWLWGGTDGTNMYVYNPSNFSVSYASSAGNADTLDNYHGSNFLGKNGNSYYQADTWIQCNGYHGLYAPSWNNAHFYPNNNSYGSWKILGSRNGWMGLHFGEGTGMTLMMNETEFGFHREANGWYARFTNGTGHFNITGSAASASSASIASQVSINYNNDSNSTYQMLWGSGNSVYGTNNVYVNPYLDRVYARSFEVNNPSAGIILTSGSFTLPWDPNQSYPETVMEVTGSQVLWGTTYYPDFTIKGPSYNWGTGVSEKYRMIQNTYDGTLYVTAGSGSLLYLGKNDVTMYQTGSQQSQSGEIYMTCLYGVHINPEAEANFYTDYTLKADGWNITAGQPHWTVLNSAAGWITFFEWFTEGAAGTGRFEFHGNVYAYSYNSLSDESEKENITNINNAIEIVSNLRGVNYDWIKTGENAYGFIAQEVSEIIPQAVNIDTEGIYSLNYNQIIALHNEAIKELRAEIELLKQEIKELKNG